MLKTQICVTRPQCVNIDQQHNLQTQTQNKIGSVLTAMTYRCVNIVRVESSNLYLLCVFIALSNQHAKRRHLIILSCVVCLAVPYFSTLSNKRNNFQKKIFKLKVPFFILSETSEKFLFLRKIRRNIVLYIFIVCVCVLCKVPIILLRIYQNMKFLYPFCKDLKY